jgi:tRNA-binding protein
MSPIIDYAQFSAVELRLGCIVKAQIFEKARKPSYQIWADFGPDFGIKQTSAQVTELYTPESLIGQKIVGCLNLGDKNIAGFISEFLLLGFSTDNGAITLISPQHDAPLGSKLH